MADQDKSHTASRLRIFTFIGLAFALVLSSIGPTRYLPHVAGFDSMYVREWFWWTPLAFVVIYVLVVERKSLASIISRPCWRDRNQLRAMPAASPAIRKRAR